MRRRRRSRGVPVAGVEGVVGDGTSLDGDRDLDAAAAAAVVGTELEVVAAGGGEGDVGVDDLVGVGAGVLDDRVLGGEPVLVAVDLEAGPVVGAQGEAVGAGRGDVEFAAGGEAPLPV